MYLNESMFYYGVKYLCIVLNLLYIIRYLSECFFINMFYLKKISKKIKLGMIFLKVIKKWIIKIDWFCVI